MMVLLLFEICGIQNNQVDGSNVTAEDKSFQSLLSNLFVLANYYYSFTFKIVPCFNRNDIFSGKRQNIFTFSLLFYGKCFHFKGAKDVQRKPLNEEEFRFSWLILQVLVVSYNKERKIIFAPLTKIKYHIYFLLCQSKFYLKTMQIPWTSYRKIVSHAMFSLFRMQ